jgi:hypothetical protein
MAASAFLLYLKGAPMRAGSQKPETKAHRRSFQAAARSVDKAFQRVIISGRVLYQFIALAHESARPDQSGLRTDGSLNPARPEVRIPHGRKFESRTAGSPDPARKDQSATARKDQSATARPDQSASRAAGRSALIKTLSGFCCTIEQSPEAAVRGSCPRHRIRHAGPAARHRSMRSRGP